MKPKTNRQVLTKAIKELSDIDLVFLRERLLTTCDETLKNREEVVESMKNSIISPNLYLESLQNIQEKIDFNQ